MGIEGNMIADEMAKEGVLLTHYVIEDLSVPIREVKEVQAAISNDQSYDVKFEKFLLEKKELDSRLLVGIFTGLLFWRCRPIMYVWWETKGGGNGARNSFLSSNWLTVHRKAAGPSVSNVQRAETITSIMVLEIRFCMPRVNLI